MAAGRVEIDLVARDLITPILGKLKSSLRDTFLGNLAADLTLKGVDAALSGVAKLQSAIGDAMSIQTQSIGNANNLAGVTGLSFSKATGIIDGLNLKLAEVAAALPGTAQDFVSAANMIAPAFAEGFGKITEKNIPDFQNQLTDLTKNMVLLGQTAQVSSADVAEFSRGFISGTRSFEELRDLNFGTKNPAFMKAVQDELKRQGLETKNFQKLTAEQRKALLLATSQRLVNPEAIAALQNSAEGILAAAKDNLFDPTRGVFGVLRKVASEGNRSVLDSFTDFLKTSNRLGASISELAKKAGLTIDPMKLVIDAIDGLNDFLVGIQRSLDFKSGLGQMQSLDFTAVLNGLVHAMSGFVSYVFNGADYVQIGRVIGNLIGRSIAAIVRVLLDPQAWLTFARTLKDGVAAIGKLALGLVAGLIEGLVTEGKKAIMGWVTGVQALAADLATPFVALANGIGYVVSRILGVIQAIPSKLAELNPITQIEKLNPFKAENPDGSKTPLNQAKDFIGSLGQNIPTGAALGSPVSFLQPSLAQPPLGNSTAQSTQNVAFNVSVNAQSNADPNAIAQTVMQAISDGYKNFKQTSLA